MAAPEEPSVILHPLADAADGRVSPHLQSLVRWVHEASNPFADWYFGGPDVAVDMIGEWVCRDSSELYIGRAVMAFPAGGGEAPMGCLLGMDGDTLRHCRSADFVAFCDALGGGDEADAVLAEVLPAARTLFPPVAARAFYISRVAVAPDARGRGVGRALVSRVMDIQRDRGVEGFCLDVSADNEAALRAYRALGFRIEGTARDEGSGLTYHRMCVGG
jgi:ribosomal protein S18 acetylase RimI-like enzyme